VTQVAQANDAREMPSGRAKYAMTRTPTSDAAKAQTAKRPSQNSDASVTAVAPRRFADSR